MQKDALGDNFSFHLRLVGRIAVFTLLPHLFACSPAEHEQEDVVEEAARQAASEDLDSPAARAALDGFFLQPAPQDFVLPPGGPLAPIWSFTTQQPPAGWQQLSFNPAGWSQGRPGFFAGGSAREDVPTTYWPDDSLGADGRRHLWLRTNFSLSASDAAALALWGRWDDGVEIYINGVAALGLSPERYTPGYHFLGLTPQARQALRPGQNNVIAAHVIDEGGGRYFDLGLLRSSALLERPSRGFAASAPLDAIAQTVKRFMIERGIPSGAVAIGRGDRVVLSQSIGWTTKTFAEPLQENAVFRLASNDKLLTQAGIRRLIAKATRDRITNQLITEDTPVFPLLAAHGLTPGPGRSVSPLTNQITVGHLLYHRSGIQELPSPWQLYQDLNVAPGTSTAVDNVRWLMGAQPRFTPGSAEQYSSAGYMLLRHLIEVQSSDLIGFLRNEVLAPAGTGDVFVAAERPSARQPSEPFYATLEEPYDRWVNLENYTALSATAPAMVKFLRRYHLSTGAPMFNQAGAWAPSDLGTGVFYGSMAGTWSLSLQRRSDQVNVSVLFNKSGYYDELTALLQAQLNAMTEADWGATPINFAQYPPTVDGVKDGAWQLASSITAGKIIRGQVGGSADLSAQWSAAWDAQNLYVWVDVKDDHKRSDSANLWDDDSVEIYLDTNNSRGQTYDGINDAQFVFGIAGQPVQVGSRSIRNTTGVRHKVINSVSGYSFEIVIPWSTLGAMPSATAVFGLDVHVNDDDDGAGRDAKLATYANTDVAWEVPAVFGAHTLAPTPLPFGAVATSRVSQRPVIDGVADALWLNASVLSQQQNVAREIRPSITSAVDASAYFRTTYDPQNLYVFVDVSDDVFWADSALPWEDDSIEIYIDANNSRGQSYDGTNDFQFIFRPGQDTVTVGARSINRTNGIVTRSVLHANTRPSKGYTMEIAIPFSLLGVPAEQGHQLGFDVHVNDDDNGALRDGKLSFHAQQDDAWTNPSTFGRIFLAP